jgi:hypothetical protein
MFGHSLMMVWADTETGDSKSKAKAAIVSIRCTRNTVFSSRLGVMAILNLSGSAKISASARTVPGPLPSRHAGATAQSWPSRFE